MKIATEELDRLISACGFTSTGPAVHEALERMTKQWTSMIVSNLSQVAPRGTKITRRHFTALDKKMGPVAGALHKGIRQSGGDYWQAAEYYGGVSGRYHASPGAVHSSDATSSLTRQGIPAQKGGDYWQAAEYYGGVSGRYHSSPGAVHSSASTSALTRQGIPMQKGGAAAGALSLASTKQLLKGTDRKFSEEAVKVMRTTLNAILHDTLQRLHHRYPTQPRLNVVMLSLAV